MSESDRLAVAIIIASVRQGRFGPTVAEWFAAEARRRDDVEVDVIDLAEAWLPSVLPAGDTHRPQAVQDLAPWLAAADAFVIVTPEYNHSFPASLKNAIDWYGEEWEAKPVAFVSYGDAAGGLRAVEQLRPVFACLQAMTIRETVSFHHHRDRFDRTGRPMDPDSCNAAAAHLLDELTWWGRALRAARHPVLTTH